MQPRGDGRQYQHRQSQPGALFPFCGDGHNCDKEQDAKPEVGIATPEGHRAPLGDSRAWMQPRGHEIGPVLEPVRVDARNCEGAQQRDEHRPRPHQHRINRNRNESNHESAMHVRPH